MSGPRVALVSCPEALALDEDLSPLADALAAAGAGAHLADWRDPELDWRGFDLAVVRSTWDYWSDLETFLAWVDETARVTTLLNPPEAIRWSADKRYLAELAGAGVPVTPTRFIAPGEEVDLPEGDVVVKPAVGAGSNDALRFRPGDDAAARAHARSILSSGRSVLVQPYLAGVDAAGETGLLFAGGRFSHAFRKGAILAGTEVPFVDGLYAAEDISPRTATQAEIEVGLAALAVAPGGPDFAYGRVDVLPGPDGTPVVLEVELVEPSLFLSTDLDAAARFAAAILAEA